MAIRECATPTGSSIWAPTPRRAIIWGAGTPRSAPPAWTKLAWTISRWCSGRSQRTIGDLATSSGASRPRWRSRWTRRLTWSSPARRRFPTRWRLARPRKSDRYGLARGAAYARAGRRALRGARDPRATPGATTLERRGRGPGRSAGDVRVVDSRAAAVLRRQQHHDLPLQRVDESVPEPAARR